MPSQPIGSAKNSAEIDTQHVCAMATGEISTGASKCINIYCRQALLVKKSQVFFLESVFEKFKKQKRHQSLSLTKGRRGQKLLQLTLTLLGPVKHLQRCNSRFAK